MNKTVNINLGGMFFHIDEDAFQKLTRYFDAIKRSLSNSSGQEEIIKDIEIRIAELVAEKHANEKQVISISELDEIIAVMGQPEDYRIDNDGEEPVKGSNFNATTDTGRKKLYRDKDGGMIGGVLSGLGYYFGIDKVWLRIFLLIMLFAWGTGVLAYIILWIVMPEAVTTSEKLEMMGEPVTISNIEKKVREEFESVSEKIKSADYDKMGNQVKSGAEKIGSSFGDFILTILKIFAKFLGVILIMSGLTVLVLLLIGVFTLGSNAVIDLPWQSFIEAGNFTDYPIWSFGLLMFFAVGIPFFFLVLLGFKLLAPSVKSIGNIATYTLLAIWLICVALAISIGIQQATAYATDGRVVLKESISMQANDTLHIKFRYNEYYAKSEDDHDDFMITLDSSNTKVIYSNNVSLRIVKTDEKLPYLQIEKEAKGKSLSEAKQRAEKITYGYSIIGNQLILDNYLITNLNNKFRDQEIEITLFLPEGTLFKTDASVENYDRSDDDFFNLHYSSDKYLYQVKEEQVKCLNCPADENEYNDVDADASSDITINENGITIKNDTIKNSNKDIKELKINKDGIIIKTE
jgi:phage shock protein PspC (stress-responsive transcriptional regulator)